MASQNRNTDVPGVPVPEPHAETTVSFSMPSVEVSGQQLRDLSAEVLDILEGGNDPPSLFVHGNTLARVVSLAGMPKVDALTENSLTGILTRASDFVQRSDRHEIPVAPPVKLVRDLLSLPSWPFPILEGIVRHPLLRQDGSLFSKPGYDPKSRLLYVFDPSLSVARIPEIPSAEEVRHARDILLDLVNDFPFDSDASRAHAIAALMTPLLRQLVDGLCPLTMINKPERGTGAGLLGDVISVSATGSTMPILAPPKDEEAMRKAITSMLLSSTQVVMLDNVEQRLSSPTLAAALTANMWTDRLLGQTKILHLPNRLVWFASGNNLTVGGDLGRRCVLVRMDARRARPWERPSSSFLHFPLLSWVQTHRGEIIWAVLTLARAWIDARRPLPADSPPMGGFEQWRNTIGGILKVAGIDGFLGNAQMLHSQMDTENEAMGGFIEAVDEAFPKDFITAELITRLKGDPVLRAAVPDTLADLESKGYAVKMGIALTHVLGRVYANGLCLVNTGKKRQRATVWSVQHVPQEDSLVPEANSESCESVSCRLREPRKSLEEDIEEDNEEDNEKRRAEDSLSLTFEGDSSVPVREDSHYFGQCSTDFVDHRIDELEEQKHSQPELPFVVGHTIKTLRLQNGHSWQGVCPRCGIKFRPTSKDEGEMAFEHCPNPRCHHWPVSWKLVGAYEVFDDGRWQLPIWEHHCLDFKVGGSNHESVG